jgi:hypothetical protein
MTVFCEGLQSNGNIQLCRLSKKTKLLFAVIFSARVEINVLVGERAVAKDFR